MTSATACSPRADELLHEQQQRVYVRTDRLFAVLLVAEWIFAVLIAWLVSPRAWAGLSSTIHVHVWYALFLGGLICSVPAVLGWMMPGRTITRHAIAFGQMLMSALLIHLTGGRIETHFHVFGSLAFLAFYRDWRVLVTATAVVATDHLVRGYYWPQSVYGVASGAEWRWLEHAGWVVFEDFFLVIACLQGVTDMQRNAEREAELELMYQSAISAAEARRAGMAEVATGVLHNVGNVLNSVNVSVSVLDKQIKNSKVSSLSKATSLLVDHQGDIGAFLERDDKGKKLPEFLFKVSDALIGEQEQALREIAHLTKSVEHIKDIVNVHQQYAGSSTVNETVNVAAVINDAVQMNATSITRTEISIVTDCPSAPPVLMDKHKVLQILLNLLSNAKHSLDDVDVAEKTIRIRTEQEAGRVRLVVADNGMGITEENLPKMFTYGFTTRKGGHGFGLHSCALAAQEMGGTISVASEGAGKGATFTLDIPVGAKA